MSQYSQTNDRIEIIIRDASFQKIFSGEAKISSKSDLKALLNKLRAKGIDMYRIALDCQGQESDWFT